MSAPPLLMVMALGAILAAMIVSLSSSAPDANARFALTPIVACDVPSNPVNVPTVPPLPPMIVPIVPPLRLMFPRMAPALAIVPKSPAIAFWSPDMVPVFRRSRIRLLFWIALPPPAMTPVLVSVPIEPSFRIAQLELVIVPELTSCPMSPWFQNPVELPLFICPELTNVAIVPRLSTPNMLPPNVPLLVNVPMLPVVAT